MKLYIATTLLLLCQLAARAEVQPPNLDSMYNCLDDAIAHADVYFARKELAPWYLQDNMQKNKQTK